MASSFGIDGLASGLDTTGIINQLMALERAPVTRMEQRIKENDAAKKSLQAFSTAMDSIETMAKGLSGAAATFMPVKASSSAASVVATASAGASTGTFSFTVDALAGTHRLASKGSVAATTDTVATASSTVRITIDGTDHDIDTGDGSLGALIENINSTTGLGVKAQAINTGSGYKLQLAARESGAAASFTFDTTNMDTAFASGGTAGDPMLVLTQGTDASITLGDGPGKFSITSASNTFAGAIDGLTFTVTEADPTKSIQVSVNADADSLVSKAKAFTEAINKLLMDFDQALNSGKDDKKGSLANDPTVRSMRSQLLNAVTFGIGGTTFGSAGLIGIESTRTGGLTFNESTFRAKLASDPDGVREVFRTDDAGNPGIAQRVRTLAEAATKFNTGTFATAMESRTSRNTTLRDAIDRTDIRLELKRAALQRQFSGLEVALQKMNSQSDWLAGQLPALQANSPK